MSRRKDSGASLIEVSLVLPILVFLAIGLSEVGFLVIDYLTVTNAARSGARTGAAAADAAGSDFLILNVVEEAACNLRFGNLEQVTIYEAESDGSIPDPPGSLVNVYENSGSLLCDADGHGLSAAPGCCPWTEDSSARDNVPPTFDSIGVEVVFSHEAVTGLFPFPTVNWTETAVMQLEPDTRGQQ